MTHYDSCCAWPDMVIYSRVKERAIIQLYITLETTPESSTFMFGRQLCCGCVYPWLLSQSAPFWCLKPIEIRLCIVMETILSPSVKLPYRKVSEITCHDSLWLMLCKVTWSDLPLWAVAYFDSFALICTHAVQGHMSLVMSASKSHMLTSLSDA